MSLQPHERLRYVLLAVLVCAFAPADAPAGGLAVSEEPAVVVVEEEPAVVVGDEDSAAEVWNPRPAVVQQREGRTFYLRPNGEAFVDPDERLSLEIKYFFPLAETNLKPDVPKHSLNRAAELPEDARLLLAPSARVKLHAGTFPIAVDSDTSSGRLEIEWLDYQAARPQRAVLLITGRAAAPVAEDPSSDATDKRPDAAGRGATADSSAPPEASLQVLRLRAHDDGWEVTRGRAARSLAEAELPERWTPGGLLDTWDRWPELGDRAAFVGRVIAVLKQIDGRYAVDFYGESLHRDSDCRVWLGPVGHAWGRPVAIRFVDLPVQKSEDTIGRISALAIYYEDGESKGRWVAIDYPLCRSPMLDQLRQIARQLESRRRARNRRPAPQLRDIVGEDLADELERRLVDGVYR